MPISDEKCVQSWLVVLMEETILLVVLVEETVLGTKNVPDKIVKIILI